MRRGAIILCGGTNRRMGTDKGLLPFGPNEVMLQRVVRLVSQVISPQQIVCAAAPEQQLPKLLRGVRVARDQEIQRGPLEGIKSGLVALTGEVDVAFVTSCDVPLLEPRLIERMFQLLGDYKIVVPQEGDFVHPLVAVYRMDVLASIQGQLDANQLRLTDLLKQCLTRTVPVDELRDFDTNLSSLAVCNTHEEYLKALQQSGLENS